MLPFTIDPSENINFDNGDYIVIEGIKSIVASGKEEIAAKLINNHFKKDLKLQLKSLSEEERNIILSGCLINYYRKQ